MDFFKILIEICIKCCLSRNSLDCSCTILSSTFDISIRGRLSGSFWDLFLRIVTFPSICTSCNSYSLILLQNYSEALAVLTQGFPLMRSNIFKFLLLTVSQVINHFCFLNIYLKNSFCLVDPVILKFTKGLLV